MKPKHLKRKIYSIFITIIFTPLFLIIRFLPYRILQLLAKTTTFFTLFLQRRNKRIMTANLNIAFPEISKERIKEIIFKSSYSFILTILESTWFRYHPNKLQELIECDPKELELLRKIQESKTGIIVLTPHLGNWEATSSYISNAGLKVTAIAKKVKIPFLNRLFAKTRAAQGSDILESTGAARGLFRALRNGHITGMLMDQNTKPRRGGIYCDFFGLPVPTTRMPASMILRAKAKAISTSCLHTDKGLKLSFSMIDIPEDMTDEIQLTQLLLKVNEEQIRRNPEQWLWNYERFRYLAPNLTREQQKRMPFYAMTEPQIQN